MNGSNREGIVLDERRSEGEEGGRSEASGGGAEGLNDWLRGTPCSFEQVVQLEQARAERYNHYFAVALLSTERLPMGNVLRPVALATRRSDLLGLVDPEGRYHRVDADRECAACFEAGDDLAHDWRIGIVFPETDRAGAATALRRILSSLTADNGVAKGCAVYPDDSTDARELISRAAG